jgi:exodeoxyribonuclease VIII
MSELTGLVYGLDEQLYHAHPSLSSTGVRLLLPEYKGSPKKFQWAQTHPRTSRTFDVGHAVHTKVLGVGAGIVTYPEEHLTPSGNPSTSKTTVLWEIEQRAAGYTVVSPGDARSVDAMAEAVLKHEDARPLFEVAEFREVSVFADVDGVPCRARFDALSGETRNGIYAVDLKTTEDATFNGFVQSVKKWGYDVQQAHYDDVYKASEGRGIDDFSFVLVEKSAPYEVAVKVIEPFWVDMGRKKTARARELFEECTSNNDWPGYATGRETVTAPAYVTIDHEMQYDNAEITF